MRNVYRYATGPLNITWNGVGVIQVPKGGKTDKDSNNVCKTVLIQRKEQIMAEAGLALFTCSCCCCASAMAASSLWRVRTGVCVHASGCRRAS
jgi:hypothetical protein